MIKEDGLKNPKGMDLELPEGAVTVKDGTGESVTVVVKNFWNETANISAFHYVDDYTSRCDPRSLVPVGDKLEFEVSCFDGYSDFYLYLYFGEDGMAMEDCAECEIPKENSTSAAAFYLSLDCREVCETRSRCDLNRPQKPECEDDIFLVNSVGVTPFPFWPITITSQMGEYVDFKVTNPFLKSFTKMYIQLHDTWVGSSDCSGTGSMLPCDEESFRGYCLSHSKQTLVDLWFVNDVDLDREVDDADIPKCCESDYEDDEKGTVQYTFVIKCEPQCVEEDTRNRRVEEVDITLSGVEPQIEDPERLAHISRQNQLNLLQKQLQQQQEQLRQREDERQQQVNNLSNNNCSAKEYPCGLFDDMVQVCHYSTKRGYQTFCVSETDAEVLAFYPDDYCGPCTGGYSRKKKHLVL